MGIDGDQRFSGSDVRAKNIEINGMLLINVVFNLKSAISGGMAAG
jgi:hypothetical protein